MKAKLRKHFEEQGKKSGLAGLALLVFVNNAMAALPPEITAAFTATTETWTGISGLMWGLATLITVGFAGLRLFKKGVNRAI